MSMDATVNTAAAPYGVPPLSPVTPEEMVERLQAAGFQAPDVTEVMLPGADGPEQALSCEEYLGWLAEGVDALRRDALEAAVARALGTKKASQRLTACLKQWKVRVKRRGAEIASASA